MNVKNVGLIAGAVLKVVGVGFPIAGALGMTLEQLLAQEGYDATGKAPETVKAELEALVAQAANEADEETDHLLAWFPHLREQ